MIAVMERDIHAQHGLRILVVATKTPWPPVGGGSVALNNLLFGLGRIGWPVRVLALGPGSPEGAPYPVRVSAERPRSSWLGVLRLLLGRPPSLTRWSVPKLSREVTEELESWRPDIVHVEQVQLAWLLPSLLPRIPVVLRQQNVESRILERRAALKSGPLAWFLRWEAHRVQEVEAKACREATVVAPISPADAAVFLQWIPEERIVVVPAPFAATPSQRRPAIEGHPPILCLGSFDWAPNRDGARWFLREVWPLIRAGLPEAVLHLAGPGSPKLAPRDGPIRVHGVVGNPLELYGDGTIAVVPVRAGSGVRLRILEAWSAGDPVITTAIGAEGLASGPEEGVLVANESVAMAAAVVRLAGNPEARTRLTTAGSKQLKNHDPITVARRACHAYHRAREIHQRRA